MPSTIQLIATSGTVSWTATSNWQGGVAPASGDTVICTYGGANLELGLAQSAITLANLIVGANFQGTIGAQTTPLAISATSWNFAANSAGRINIDFGTNAFIGTMLSGNTGGADSGLGLLPVRVKGIHASNKIYCLGGTIGIATNTPTDTATVPEIDILNTGTNVTCGSGCTLTLLTQGAGTCFVNSALPNLNQGGGALTTAGSGPLGATALVIGGTVTSNSTGAVRNAVIQNGGLLDFSQTPAARSATEQIQIYRGGKIIAPILWTTLTGGFATVGCRLSEITADFGSGRQYVVT